MGEDHPSARYQQSEQAHTDTRDKLQQDRARLVGAVELSVAPEYARDAVGNSGEQGQRQGPVPAPDEGVSVKLSIDERGEAERNESPADQQEPAEFFSKHEPGRESAPDNPRLE